MISLVFVLSLFTHIINALDNGLALTPPMGWIAWERFRCTVDCNKYPDTCLNEELVKQHADILSQPEWRKAGYEYVNVDDCWSDMERDASGRLVGNSTRFPSGIKALADYVHSKGLKLGIYNDIGTKTCGLYPGECKDESCTLPGYMAIDAQTYADWGVDSLKMDGCNSIHTPEVLDPAYIFMGDALNKTGRQILYSCEWPFYLSYQGIANTTKVANHCNIWRMYKDIGDAYDVMVGIIDWVGDNAVKYGYTAAAGSGAWNDPDALIIGNFALSYEQSKMQMALWAIMAAPLLMGNDLRNLDPEMKEILLAGEVIAVNQDPLGKQGFRVAKIEAECANHDIWMRQLSGGDIAVVLWARSCCGTPLEITVTWDQLGLDSKQSMKVRELFLRKDFGTFAGSFTTRVNLKGVVMVRLSKDSVNSEI